MTCLTPQSVGTITVEVAGDMARAALEDFLQTLLWEKTVHNSAGDSIDVLRLKVAK